jgi:hypothetical protein
MVHHTIRQRIAAPGRAAALKTIDDYTTLFEV